MAVVNPKKLDDKAYDWLFHRLEAAIYWGKPPHLQWRYDQDGSFAVFTGRQVIEGRSDHLMEIADHDYDDPKFLQSFWFDSFFIDLCNRYYDSCGEEQFTSVAEYFYKQALKRKSITNRSSIYTRHVPDWGLTLIVSVKCETLVCIVPERHSKSFCIASAHHEDNVITLSHL